MDYLYYRGPHGKDPVAASSSRKWPLVNSQQENNALSTVITGNRILPTTGALG